MSDCVNVEVYFDTDSKISGPVLDMLYDCGIELLQTDGKAIVVNQCDVMKVDGDLWVAIDCNSFYYDAMDNLLESIHEIDRYRILEGCVLIWGEDVVIDDDVDIENCKDMTTEIMSSNI